MRNLLAVLVLIAASHAATADTPSQEAFEVANAFVDAFNERDERAMAAILDMEAVARRAAPLVSNDPEFQNGFIQGATQSKNQVVANILRPAAQQEGWATLRKVERRAGFTWALVRMTFGDGALDYMDLVLSKEGAESTRVIDWYSLSAGVLVSTQLGGTSQLFTNPSPSLIERLFGTPTTEDTAKSIQEIIKLNQSGQPAAAFGLYKKLPESLQNERAMINMALGINAGLNDEAGYRMLLDRLAEHHGDDPSASFLLIDHYFYNNEFDKALHSIDVMEKRVGVDGATAQLRANLLLASGDLERARAAAAMGLEAEPDFDRPYYAMIDVCISAEDFDCAVQHYRTLEDRFGYQFDRTVFEQFPELADFMASPEFTSWLPE